MKRVGVPAQRVWAIAVIGTTLRFYFYIFLSRFLLCVPVKTPRSILERETQSSRMVRVGLQGPLQGSLHIELQARDHPHA